MMPVKSPVSVPKCNYLKHFETMAHDGDLKQKAIDLYKSGKSKSFIAKVLNVSKPSVGRWLQNIETKNETSITLLKPFEIANPEDWYSQSVTFSEEIAASNRELRLTLTDMLKKQLEDEEISARVITCLSSAIERHTELEWKARGLDYLEANRAIARVVSMGYEINDSSSQIVAEGKAED